LLLLVDDPKDCELVDCTKDSAVDLCPKTCSPKNELTKEPEICKAIDCSKPNSSQRCPLTCAASTKVAGCIVYGQAGDGTQRGTCNEGFNCHADGICKPICTVHGSKGDGMNRGSCNEGRICYRDGSCRLPGLD